MPHRAHRLRARVQAVARVLRGHDHFAVIGHVDPDLDSIGSVLALTGALRALGKRCTPISPDPDPPQWRFLPGHEDLVYGSADGLKPDVAVVVDTEVSPQRLGKAWPVVEQSRLRVNIDHHDTNDVDVDVRLVEPQAAATGELVYHVVRALGVDLTAAIAEPLYAAILTDTGGFRFSNTRAQTFRIAAQLVDKGVSPHEVAIRVFDTRPLGFMHLLGRALSGMQETDDGLVAWLEVPRALAEQAGLSPSEMEGLVQYPRMVEGVEVAILFKEVEPSRTRVSLRSQRYVDVSAIARRFGGGGHLRAAGCTLEQPLPRAVELVVAEAHRAARAGQAVDGQDLPKAGLAGDRERGVQPLPSARQEGGR